MALHALLHDISRRFGLSAPQTRQLWDLSGLHQAPARLAPWLERGLAALAALLLGAGLVFWVAANWQAQSRSVKLMLLQGAVALPVLAALALPRWRNACLLLATLALGGLLAYVGQTYQTGADAWQLFAAWAALALPWAVAARRDALWALWLLVAGTALGLWSGQRIMDPSGLLLGWSWSSSWLESLMWLPLLALPLALPALKLVPQSPARLSSAAAAVLCFAAWTGYGLAGLLMTPGSALYILNLGLCALALYGLQRQRPPDLPSLGAGLLALNALFLGGAGKNVLDGFHADGLLLMTLLSAASLGASGTWLWRVQQRASAQPPAPPAATAEERAE